MEEGEKQEEKHQNKEAEEQPKMNRSEQVKCFVDMANLQMLQQYVYVLMYVFICGRYD